VCCRRLADGPINRLHDGRLSHSIVPHTHDPNTQVRSIVMENMGGDAKVADYLKVRVCVKCEDGDFGWIDRVTFVRSNECIMVCT
jgi:hypothetical protein